MNLICRSLRARMAVSAAVLACAATATATTAATAATTAAAPSASEAGLPLWEVGVIGGAVRTPAYPGAQESVSRALALPFFIYRGEVFRADQSGINARLLRSDVLELDIGLAASLPSRSDDVAARSGMQDLGTLVEFGPRIKWRIADLSPNSRLRFDLPLRAVLELRSGVRTQGWTLEPRFVYEMRGPQGRWTFDAQAGLVAGDRKVNAYFYEVRPEEATVSRPTYHAQSGLMLTRVGVSGSRMLGDDLRLFGFARYDSYANGANRDSPLVKRETGTSVGFGVAWTIHRSARRASASTPL